MPVTDDQEFSPLAVLAVNTLSDTYKQSGPDALDDDALILFLAVGSIIARTRGRDVLHKAMEALRIGGRRHGPTPRRPITRDQLSLPG